MLKKPQMFNKSSNFGKHGFSFYPELISSAYMDHHFCTLASNFYSDGLILRRILTENPERRIHCKRSCELKMLGLNGAPFSSFWMNRFNFLFV